MSGIGQCTPISGCASVRRFPAAFVAHDWLNLTQVRRSGDGRSSAGCGTLVRLGYRPPCDVAAVLSFFAKRYILLLNM